MTESGSLYTLSFTLCNIYSKIFNFNKRPIEWPTINVYMSDQQSISIFKSVFKQSNGFLQSNRALRWFSLFLSKIPFGEEDRNKGWSATSNNSAAIFAFWEAWNYFVLCSLLPEAIRSESSLVSVSKIH